MTTTAERPTTTTAQSLVLSDLVKTYASRGRESVTAVKGIDLSIEPGELVALLGHDAADDRRAGDGDQRVDPHR
jgi:ABC-type polysaccharide/polyol phosphate transport system ATPase subunit